MIQHLEPWTRFHSETDVEVNRKESTSDADVGSLDGLSGVAEREREGPQTCQEVKAGLVPLHFSCWVCSENCKVKLFGIVTIPSGNINYIEQNLFSLLKSQHKTS